VPQKITTRDNALCDFLLHSDGKQAGWKTWLHSLNWKVSCALQKDGTQIHLWHGSRNILD